MMVDSRQKGREETLESLKQAQIWIEMLDARTLPRDPLIRHLYREVKNAMTTLIESQSDMIKKYEETR